MANYNITMKQKNASGGYDNLYPATVASQVSGVYTSGQVDSQITNVRNVVSKGWQLQWSRTTAGSGTWTAPNLFNGQSYKIGVWIVGGGGSGGYKKLDSGGKGYIAGASSGYSKTMIIDVTPGTSFAYVVGAGGVANSSSTSTLDGSSSSFNGVVAYGGGHTYFTNNIFGRKKSGGEMSYVDYNTSGGSSPYAAIINNEFDSVGRDSIIAYRYIENTYSNDEFTVQSGNTICMFDSDLRLCSGQAVAFYSEGGSAPIYYAIQKEFRSKYGYSSRPGIGTSEGSSANATIGTMPGCGGASVLLTSTGTGDGANGAAGGVFIFVEGKA